ncbi:MAG: Ig-like domain-containing protein [bacterium]|nr:Ig-like domain-containing protein [bacterium]
MKTFIKLFNVTFILLFCIGENSYALSLNQFIDNTNPPLNAVSVDRHSDIKIVFNQSLNPATINTGNIKVFGYFRGLLPVNVSYEQATKTLTIDPNAEMKIGEIISVTLTDDIMTMGGQNITPFVYKFTVHTIGGNGIFI